MRRHNMSLEQPVRWGCSRHWRAKTGYSVQVKTADVYSLKVVAAKAQACAVSEWAMQTLVDQ